MANNQDQPQIVYQQPAFPAAAYNNGVAWNHPQPVFAVPYPGEVTYAEKAQYGGYPALPYAQEVDMHRQAYAYGVQSQYRHPYVNYGATYSTAIEPYVPAPNMSRPPPHQQQQQQPGGIKRDGTVADNFQHIGVLENQAQSAAAYTASWVSSTSSIPPELRDEPEYQTDVNVGHWDARTGPQWPGLGEDGRAKDDKNKPASGATSGGSSSGGAAAPAKKEEVKEKRLPKEDPKELTWEARVQKAKSQLDRVEQRGTNEGGSAPSKTSRPPNNKSPSAAGAAPAKGEKQLQQQQQTLQQGQEHQTPQAPKQVRTTTSFNVGLPLAPTAFNHMAYNQPFGHPREPKAMYQPQMGYAPIGYPHQPVQWITQQHMVSQFHPRGQYAAAMPFLKGRPMFGVPMMHPGAYAPYIPQPIPQDEKFRNTWLDANNVPPFLHILGIMSPMDRPPRREYTRNNYQTRSYRRYDERREEGETPAAGGAEKAEPNADAASPKDGETTPELSLDSTQANSPDIEQVIETIAKVELDEKKSPTEEKPIKKKEGKLDDKPSEKAVEKSIEKPKEKSVEPTIEKKEKPVEKKEKTVEKKEKSAEKKANPEKKEQEKTPSPKPTEPTSTEDPPTPTA